MTAPTFQEPPAPEYDECFECGEVSEIEYMVPLGGDHVCPECFDLHYAGLSDDPDTGLEDDPWAQP